MIFNKVSNTKLAKITHTILDEDSSPESLADALDDFARLCSDITAITPDASFNAWAEDSFLDDGVAINPQAAAFCIKDYPRSIAFIRGVYAAILAAQIRFPNMPLKILYAGCGPFATLLLPLLVKFKPRELDLHLLDIHQQSLDSVESLIEVLALQEHHVSLIQGDACRYQHDHKLHIIVAEVMQKALEQEPQVAVTANLSPQLHDKGIFIPEKIEVTLCLGHWDDEKMLMSRAGAVDHDLLVASGQRHFLGTLLTLLPFSVDELIRSAKFNADTSMLEFKPVPFRLPEITTIEQYDLLILTRVQVFSQYRLGDYESEITLPRMCNDVALLRSGSSYQACYQLGNYPRFNVIAH